MESEIIVLYIIIIYFFIYCYIIYHYYCYFFYNNYSISYSNILFVYYYCCIFGYIFKVMWLFTFSKSADVTNFLMNLAEINKLFEPERNRCFYKEIESSVTLI
jgi:hypothetical protein